MDELSNNRSFQRVAVRTFVRVVAAQPPFQVYKAWTDDLSPSGARILCENPILENELFFEVMMPDLKGQYLAGRIVRRDVTMLPSFKSADREFHCYGVVFTGVHHAREIARLTGSTQPA